MAPRKHKKESAKEKRKIEFLQKYFPEKKQQYLKHAKFYLCLPKSCELLNLVLSELRQLCMVGFSQKYKTERLKWISKRFTELYKTYPCAMFHEMNKIIRRKNDRFKLPMLDDRRFNLQHGNISKSDKESNIVKVGGYFYVLQDYEMDPYSQRVVQNYQVKDVSFLPNSIRDVLSVQETMKAKYEIQQTIDEHAAFNVLNEDVKTKILQFL